MISDVSNVFYNLLFVSSLRQLRFTYEPSHEKTYHRGLQPGTTQTSPLRYRD